MFAIEARGLTKSYKGKAALRGVRLAVPRGSIYGFLGPNGAGKTTAIKIFVGLLHSDGGEVRVLGHPPGPREVGTRLRFGFMPEIARFPGYLRSRELLTFYARLHGLPKAGRARRIEEVLTEVGIQDARGPIKTFSKGMGQRLGLAQALLSSPELVILDEPTSGLDPGARVHFREVLARLPKEGTTVFLSSHVLAEVEAVCDRVSIIHEGTVRAEGTVQEVVNVTRGENVIGLELERAVPAVPRSLEALPFVAGLETNGSRLRVRIRDGADRRAEVSRAVTGSGGVIVEMRMEGGGLEEAFLKLVREESR